MRGGKKNVKTNEERERKLESARGRGGNERKLGGEQSHSSLGRTTPATKGKK